MTNNPWYRLVAPLEGMTFHSMSPIESEEAVPTPLDFVKLAGDNVIVNRVRDMALHFGYSNEQTYLATILALAGAYDRFVDERVRRERLKPPSSTVVIERDPEAKEKA